MKNKYFLFDGMPCRMETDVEENPVSSNIYIPGQGFKAIESITLLFEGVPITQTEYLGKLAKLR